MLLLELDIVCIVITILVCGSFLFRSISRRELLHITLFRLDENGEPLIAFDVSFLIA